MLNSATSKGVTSNFVAWKRMVENLKNAMLEVQHQNSATLIAQYEKVVKLI